jgi:SAM-dependent methyltransferase
MVPRRELLVSAAAAAIIAPEMAHALPSDTVDVVIDPKRLSPEMQALLEIRLPELDAESDEDFVVGMKRMLSSLPAKPEMNAHIEAFLRSKGMSQLDDTNLSYEQSFALLMQDPVYAARTRLSVTTQRIMWDRVMRIFHGNEDYYLAQMEKADKVGPGSLELNPTMAIPDSCRYEVHCQPGGYVGDPLGGWVYHYAVTLGFRMGTAYHDETHFAHSQGHQKPADGVVRRVLDIGCGPGQSTTALKFRFPKAEVWGIDVGGPLVRYAHLRAQQLRLDVNFAQRLAEDLKFPSGHFDMVTDSILFHEVSGASMPKIIAEVYRVLRPGGTFSHGDIATNGNPRAPLPQTVMAKASAYSTYRTNEEPWWLEFIDSDFPGLLRQAGFKVDLSKPGILGRTRIIATKPA